jgi:hypothetical protein
MKRNLLLLFLIPLGFTYSLKLYAQDSKLSGQDTLRTSDSFYWINLGVGVLEYGQSTDPFLVMGFNLSYQRRIHIISFKYFYGSQDSFFGADNEFNKLSSFDLMYGIGARKSKWHGSLSTGINISVRPFWIHVDPGPDRIGRGLKLGIPLDLQLFLSGKKVGIGLNSFVVFYNTFISYGALICLQYGKLR